MMMRLTRPVWAAFFLFIVTVGAAQTSSEPITDGLPQQVEQVKVLTEPQTTEPPQESQQESPQEAQPDGQQATPPQPEAQPKKPKRPQAQGVTYGPPREPPGRRNLAPGFGSLPKGVTISVMQPDIELFSISAGGMEEPKADWTEAALRNVKDALHNRAATLGVRLKEISEGEADELAEINTLHAAVARSVGLHHSFGSAYALPTKEGNLDWSLGEAVTPLREKTGSDYALFIWMRDSYASPERVAAIVVMAILGVGVPGGYQIGYASLVDLQTGQIMWFNQLVRGTGDLRESRPAAETVNALLVNFPGVQ